MEHKPFDVPALGLEDLARVTEAFADDLHDVMWRTGCRQVKAGRYRVRCKEYKTSVGAYNALEVEVEGAFAGDLLGGVSVSGIEDFRFVHRDYNHAQCSVSPETALGVLGYRDQIEEILRGYVETTNRRIAEVAK